MSAYAINSILQTQFIAAVDCTASALAKIKTLPSSASIVGDLNGIADKFQGLKTSFTHTPHLFKMSTIAENTPELTGLAQALENHFHAIQKAIAEFKQAIPTLEKLNTHPDDPYTKDDLDQFKKAHKKACEAFWDRFFAADDIEQAAAQFENSLTDLVIDLSNGDSMMLGLLSRELNEKTLVHLVAQAELAKTLDKLDNIKVVSISSQPPRIPRVMRVVSSGVAGGLAQSPFWGDVLAGFIEGFTGQLNPELRKLMPQEWLSWAKRRSDAWEARIGGPQVARRFMNMDKEVERQKQASSFAAMIGFASGGNSPLLIPGALAQRASPFYKANN